MKSYFTLPLVLVCIFLNGCKFTDENNKNYYHVLGHVTGLNGQITLGLNDNEELVIENEVSSVERKPYQFRQEFYSGEKIGISIIKQPESQFCYLYDNTSSGQSKSGTITEQDNSEINIYCRTYYQTGNGPQSISADYYHTCLIDNDGARCTGDDAHLLETVNITNIPSNFINPRDITTSGTHGCVIDDTGVVCWGDDDKTVVPSGLMNPREVKVGDDFSCALDDQGVKCWGWESVAIKLSSDITGATNLTVGRENACVLSNGKPVCRSISDDGISSVPLFLNNVDEISIYEKVACAIQDKKLYCWGDLIPEYTSGFQLSDNLSYISLNSFVSCLANEETVACTDQPIGNNMRDLAEAFSNIKKIEIGSHHLCAMGNSHIKCFGSNYSMQAENVTLR